MLVVQDIFLTETAALADVVLPASAFPEKTGSFTNTDRTVQMGRQALACRGRRGRTCGSSPRWRGSWAWTGRPMAPRPPTAARRPRVGRDAPA
jgi:NADH dehydrogenase/NADH:ubiquinone oxidoreductase subunit G